MKKLFEVLSLLIVLWGILVVVDYVRVYNGNKNKLILQIDKVVNDDFTEHKGIGYRIVKYDYDISTITEDIVSKEFYVLGIKVSDEKIVFNEEELY